MIDTNGYQAPNARCVPQEREMMRQASVNDLRCAQGILFGTCSA
jgi:hypothetical protein